jgi:hypothetical protein
LNKNGAEEYAVAARVQPAAATSSMMLLLLPCMVSPMRVYSMNYK